MIKGKNAYWVHTFELEQGTFYMTVWSVMESGFWLLKVIIQHKTLECRII